MRQALSSPVGYGILVQSLVIEMTTFAICDDEPHMAHALAGRLSAYMEQRRLPCQIRCFPDGRSLLADGGAFDLIFLDIQMEAPDGMETARLLRQRGSRSLLIFATVLEERVFDAFEVDAWDYLVKPIDGERFCRTMDRALRALEERPARCLVLRRGTSCQVVPLDQIVYCEVQGRKVYLHRTGGGVVDYYERLADLERRLDGRFFRCHRSYLVNLEHVRGCQAGQAVLSQGGPVPVSRLRERELAQALLRYMKERER